MRITRSYLFRMRLSIARLTSFGVLALLTLTAISATSYFISPQSTASAVTPPDSCFAFNVGTGTITNYYDNEGNNGANPACPRSVDIPSTIGGIPVTTVGNAGYPDPGAFTSKNLTSVTIPSSVTSIGNYAFYNNQLTSLTIPSSVTNIGDYAFSSNQLTSVTIPSSITSIGDYAFSDNQLTSLTIPVSVTSIGNYAFRNNQLTSVTIPGSVISIGDSAFSYNQLTTVTIPASVTSIGYFAFAWNQLTSITIQDGVTTLGSSTFFDNQLTTVTIPASVISIGDSVFSYNQLTTVTIPSSITSIGDYAFANNQLVSVTIPPSVTSIGEGSFEANGIVEISIPNSVVSIGAEAFAVQTPQGRAYDRFDRGDDPVSVAIANQTITEFFYTRLYTEDPSNPNNLQSEVVFRETELDGLDSDWDEPVVVGGHIVNPASAELHYVNQSNNSLQVSQTITGQLQGGSYLHDYNVFQGPVIPMPADSSNPSPEEQAAGNQALSAYYRIGDTVTISPPAIDGYITPATRSFVLGASTNNFSYVYASQNTGENTPTSTSGGGDTGTLAQTGSNMINIITISLAGIILGFGSGFVSRVVRR